MKVIHLTRILPLAGIISLAFAGAGQAATITSSGFDIDPSSTAIDTTGANYLDWGYFLPTADFLNGTQAADTDFDSLIANIGGDDFTATNSMASPGIGIVTLTERGDAEYSNGNTGLAWQFTIDDGFTPVSGTYNPLGAANGIGGTEDIFNITFNDLAVGTNIVVLYMDHTNTNRSFDATVDLFASDGNDSVTEFSTSILGSDGDGFFTYTVEVNTAVTGSDLSISIDSRSGSAGQFQFAGYTVTTVIPEPSIALLSALGLLVLLRRRR